MSRRRRTLSTVAGALAATSVAALLAASAMGERAQSGNVIVSLSGEIRPHFLPRLRSAPISLSFSSNFSTADGSPLPQLRRIAIAVGRRGELEAAGLPVCPVARVEVTTLRKALSECGQARVGFGRLSGEISIAGQPSFPLDGRIVAFNGRLKNGETAVLADVHSKAPPISFVMPFRLGTGPGATGTVLSAKLPRTAGGWVHVEHFDLTLGRRYSYRGERLSYLSGRCAVPAGFTGIIFPLAQATYSFAGGRSVTAVASRACSVRK